jgi:ribosomal protein L37AE/L43A
MVSVIVKDIFNYLDNIEYLKKEYNKQINLPHYINYNLLGYMSWNDIKPDIEKLLCNIEISVNDENVLNILQQYFHHYGIRIIIKEHHKNVTYHKCDRCYCNEFIVGFHNLWTCKKCSYTERAKSSVIYTIYKITLPTQITLPELINLLKKI